MTMIAERLSRIIEVVFEGSAVNAATAAGVSPPTLNRLTTGAVTSPRVTTVVQLAEAFGVRFGWLIGEMSTVAAQAGETPLAEPYWLLQQYNQRRQQPDREWLKRVAGQPSAGANREVREIIKYFSKFRLLPDGGSELKMPVSAVVDLTKEGGKTELALFRALAEVETNSLAAAVAKLRKMGIRTGEDKPTRTRQ